MPMPTGFMIAAVIVVILVFMTLKVVPEYQRLVVLRLGKVLERPKGPGIVILIPLVDKAMRVDLREKYTEIPHQTRSEEHTSELQSQSNLVCRLLLEKKKNNRHTRLDHKRPNVRRHTNHRDTREGHTNPHTKIDSNRVGDVETDQYSSDVACT